MRIERQLTIATSLHPAMEDEDTESPLEGEGGPWEQKEIREVVLQLNSAFTNLSSKLKKPNILLIGKTGAGKSSLVNALLGKSFAPTGSGQPVSNHLERFAPDDKQVVLYDTKGLEHGNHQEFLEDTRKFLGTLRSSNDISDHLHVVWYVLDMSHSRFQPFERTLCEELFPDVSLIFILNKIDTASPQQIDAVRQSIQGANFSSCRGIYGVVSDRKNYQMECCPVCFSDDFRFRQRTKELICQEESCGKRTVIGQYFGLEQLVEATVSQLPEFARFSFIVAQEVNEKSRLRLAKNVITNCATRIRLGKATGNRLAEMALKLAMLWGYTYFPMLAKQEVNSQFSQFFSHRNFFARLAMILGDIMSNYSYSEALAVGIGVELCRLLCELKMKAVGHVLRASNDELIEELDSNFVLDINSAWLSQISTELGKCRSSASLSSAIIDLLQTRIAVRMSQDDW